MYTTGGTLAGTGTALTIGGTSYSMPAVASIGAVVLALGVAVSLLAMRLKRGR